MEQGIEDINIIETDIEKIEDDIKRINCRAILDLIKDTIKFIYDSLKCFMSFNKKSD